MANRYYEQDAAAGDSAVRPEPYDGGGDPLAELARLIGQTDPVADFARGDQVPLSPRHAAEPQFDPYFDDAREQPSHQEPAASRGGWRKTTPVPPQMAEYLDARRSEAAPDERAAEPYTGEPYPAFGESEAAPRYDGPDYAADPGRYDDALYGRHADPLPADEAAYRAADTYREDGYAYDDEGDYAMEDEPPRRGKLAILAILALAVVGTGGAYAYRSLHGPLSAPAEPPVIKADTAPIKVVPPTQAAERKLVQDRLASAGGAEQLVPREEAPVDVASRAREPRIVFPPLTHNTAPATVPAATAAPEPPLAGTAEPRKIRTVAVRPDQRSAAPAAAPAPVPAAEEASAPASAQDSPTRTASINPAAGLPATTTGGYLVQVSAQRSEADARASYRILQGKFPTVFGNRQPVIRRADLGAKGVHYRAMVGPFGNQEQAAQFCGDLKSAGGACFVQRN